MNRNLCRAGVESRERSSAGVPKGRTRGNSHKLRHRKFCLNRKNNFSAWLVMERWNRLLREVVGSPCLEKFTLGTILCSLLEVSLLEQGAALLISRVPSSPSCPEVLEITALAA